MRKKGESFSLLGQLPPAMGTYRQQYPLSRITWFKVGGPAEVIYLPSDTIDLKKTLSTIPKEIEITVIGVGSNLLVRDGGISGVVIRLGRGFTAIKQLGSDLVVGAGALDILVSNFATKAGIAGLEFLSGIPGTIGGAICMNAGAYGRELSDIFVSAEAIDRFGIVHQLRPGDLSFSYRFSNLSRDLILINARLRGVPCSRESIKSKVSRIKSERELTQPIRKRTGGSTFKNPVSSELRAWELIDMSGCRGLTRGGATVSNLHCNFLINSGSATAADIEGLGEDIQDRVFDQTGKELEWEIKRIGSTFGDAR